MPRVECLQVFIKTGHDVNEDYKQRANKWCIMVHINTVLFTVEVRGSQQIGLRFPLHEILFSVVLFFVSPVVVFFVILCVVITKHVIGYFYFVIQNV